MLLLIARERLIPGMEQAYAAIEAEIAAVAAALHCPHPYLALTPDDGREVWWFNTFASEEEMRAVESAYAANSALMAKFVPLIERKAAYRESVSQTLTRAQPQASGGATLQIPGARFTIVATTGEVPHTGGAVFEGPEGERFVIATTATRAVAESTCAVAGRDAVILTIRPEWSYPDAAWITADPAFWGRS